MAKTQTRNAIVTSAANTAGSTTRGRVDVSAYDAGFLTWRMTNGGTGPTVQCLCNILVAHKDSAMPNAASQGTGDLDWKLVQSVGGGTTANASTVGSLEITPGMAYIEIEFTGNTGQSVTVEAHATLAQYS